MASQTRTIGTWMSSLTTSPPGPKGPLRDSLPASPAGYPVGIPMPHAPFVPGRAAAPSRKGGSVRHFLSIDDLSPSELEGVLDRAERPPARNWLTGRCVALLFEKPSTRTRHSTERAVVQLGGHPITVRPEEVGLDERESVEDVARTLGLYHAALTARVRDHSTLTRMQEVAGVPVVNLLSDESHPLQAIADLLTMKQEWGSLRGRTVAYVGDANNVFNCLAVGAAMMGMRVRVATPPGFGPSRTTRARVHAAGGELLWSPSPVEAVLGADAVYADVWTSMGQEAEAAERRAAFSGFTVTEELMGSAHPDAMFLHCLPVHRGEEVTGEVVDGPRSRVWKQAENRLHAVRSLLQWITQPEITA